MSLNISNVLFLLHQKFPDPLPDNPICTREETKLAGHLVNILKLAVDHDIDVEERDEVADETFSDWDSIEFEPNDGVIFSSPTELVFGGRVVTREEANTALDYYRSAKAGKRTLEAMRNRFRWITGRHDMDKLKLYEKDRDNFKESRRNLLKFLGERLYEEVKGRLDSGICLHDRDLKMIALDINKKETHVENFKACQTWITNWKRSYNIVSRKITKFVTRRYVRNKAATLQSAKDFVQGCRMDISSYGPEMIFNADQCGIQKELFGARSLAYLGEKSVERIVQSLSSLTHSFTFLPMIFMNGTLGPKAYMKIAEPTGHFPPSRPIPVCSNLEVHAGKSHIMTKDDMRVWLRNCVAHQQCPKKMLMIVDSWTSFKDHATIQSCMQNGVDLTIRNIPPGTTSLIQPLDVHFNGPWKTLIKNFTSYVMSFCPDYIIANRNNTIMMTSLLYHQVSAALFEPFLKYSWNKAGYTDSHDEFVTPADYCFGDVGEEECGFGGCSEFSFIRCARCNCQICFEHFVVDDQHFCPCP